MAHATAASSPPSPSAPSPPVPPVPPLPAPAPAASARLAVAGLLVLALAMGIGRFAFTPLMPLMMRDGLLDTADAAALAAVNYAGYLAGALLAAPLGAWAARRWPGPPWRLLLLALGLVVLSTAAMGGGPPPAWWWWRGLAGVASALALVGVGACVLPLLAAAGRPARGAWVFSGVGLGIAATGGLCWALGTWGAAALWRLLGAVALGLLVLAWAMARSTGWPALWARVSAPGAAPTVLAASGADPTQARWPVVLCYGLAGLGYILPATFLPAMARALVDDPHRFGLAWPVFGLAAAASTVLATRLLARWPLRRQWAWCQAAMALGVVLPVMFGPNGLVQGGLQGLVQGPAPQPGPSHWAATAMALSALLVGGTFMVVTALAMQWARAHAPANPTPLLARLTVAFALGQIAGPLLVRAVTAAWPSAAALAWVSLPSALALALSAGWLWRTGRPHPAAA